MPWTGGKASASSDALQAKNWSEIFINLGRTFILSASLMLIFVSLCLSVANGVSGVAVTVIAIQDLGYNSADFSYLISACSLSRLCSVWL